MLIPFPFQAIINKSYNWLRLMIPHMKISAFGLFDINHNLLFGFLGTLITYLIILVQFYSIAGDISFGISKQGAATEVLEFLPGRENNKPNLEMARHNMEISVPIDVNENFNYSSHFLK